MLALTLTPALAIAHKLFPPPFLPYLPTHVTTLVCCSFRLSLYVSCFLFAGPNECPPAPRPRWISTAALATSCLLSESRAVNVIAICELPVVEDSTLDREGDLEDWPRVRGMREQR